MVCRKCKKHFSEEFMFCPFCGVKREDSPRLAPFNRLRWFSCEAGHKDAEKAWPEMKSMSFNELECYLSEKIISFDVWGIDARYFAISFQFRGIREKLERPEQRHEEYVKLERAIEILSEHEEIRLEPAKRQIRISDLKELGVEGGSIFYTKEECQDVIDRLIAETNNALMKGGEENDP